MTLGALQQYGRERPRMPGSDIALMTSSLAKPPRIRFRA